MTDRPAVKALYFAFAAKVREYWEPRPWTWTVVISFGILALLAMLWGLLTPGRLPHDPPPPIDATPLPGATPCPSPWTVCS